MGPTSLHHTTRGVGGGGWACDPLVRPLGQLSGPEIFKNSRKIILNFQDHRRTFIFEVFFSGRLKQKTGKAKLILSFFF